MSKRSRIARLAHEAEISFVYWAKGSHPSQKSAVFEFRRSAQTIASFTSPDRALAWAEKQHAPNNP